MLKKFLSALFAPTPRPKQVRKAPRRNALGFDTLEARNVPAGVYLEGPSQLMRGETDVEFSVMVFNDQPDTNRGVVLHGNLGGGLAVDRSRPLPDHMFTYGQEFTVLCPDLAPGQYQVISLPVKVADNFRTGVYGAFAYSYASVTTTSLDTNWRDDYDNFSTYVTAAAPSLKVTMDGDSANFETNQIDANFGTVGFTVSDWNINVRADSFTVAIKTHHAAPGYSSAGGEATANLRLRNPLTGAITVGSWADTVSTETDQIDLYWFSGVKITNGSTFQILGNINPDVVRDGDTLRASVVTTPQGGGLVDIDDLLPSTSNYNLWASTTPSGLQITNVSPGGVITANSHTVVDPKLFVAVKSIGSTDTAVKNQKNVNLFRTEFFGVGQDILTYGIELKPLVGVGNNFQNFTLWFDSDLDGRVDTILEKGVSFQGGKIVFNNLPGGGIITPEGTVTILEVHADVAASTSGSMQFQLGFDTSSPTYIRAETVRRGDSLDGIVTNGVGSGKIRVTTTPSVMYTLASQGNLFVTKDTTPLRNRQLLLGALGDATLRLRFHAEYEDIDVTDLQIESVLDWQSIDRIDLYREGETTPFASATIGAAGTDQVAPGTFVAKMQSRQLVIPKGADVIVIGRPRMKPDVDSGVGGDKVQHRLNPTAISNNATGQGAVRARGAVSSNNLIANNGDTKLDGEVFIGATGIGVNKEILSAINDVVGSKIVSITNANPDANGSNVPSGYSPFFQIKVGAAPNANSKNGLNKVVLDSLIITVNATNVAIDATSLKFGNKADSTATVSAVPMNAAGQVLTGTITGTFYVFVTGLTASAVNTIIDQGTDQIFVLWATVTNPQIVGTNTSTLQGSLTNFSDRALSSTFSVLGSHFAWYDMDSGIMKKYFWVEYPTTVVNSTSYQS